MPDYEQDARFISNSLQESKEWQVQHQESNNRRFDAQQEQITVLRISTAKLIVYFGVGQAIVTALVGLLVSKYGGH